jgi:acetyl esterase/lipase
LSDKKALPVVVYLHGGGFITSIGAASIVYHHGFCSNLASHLQAIIMSVEYHLAPEHRLPAASDDAIEATHFIKK